MYDSVIQAIVILAISLFVAGGIIYIAREDKDKLFQKVCEELNDCLVDNRCC